MAFRRLPVRLVLTVLAGLTLLVAIFAFSQTGTAVGVQQTRGMGSPPAPEETEEEELPVISGGERISWDYQLADRPLSAFQFLLYVNAERHELSDFRCDPTDVESVLTCSARLPPLGAGTHTLMVSALDSDSRIEGPPSNAIRIRVQPSNESFPPETMRSLGERTANDVTSLTDGFTDAVDLAALPDGRLLIAERSGVVHVFDPQGARLLTVRSADDVRRDDSRRLFAVAPDRNFDKTNTVFIVEQAEDGTRLVRFRLSGDLLLNTGVLVDRLPTAARDPSAALDVGVDGKLYLALDDGDDRARSGDAAALNAKVLRLNEDGTTPRDQAAHSPIFFAGPSRPVGVSSYRINGGVVVVGGGADGAERLYTAVGEGVPARGAVVNARALPPNFSASDLLVGDPSVHASLEDRVLVAGAPGILNLPLSEASSESRWLLRGVGEPIRALEWAPDRAVYALTPKALVRIALVAAVP